MVPQIGLAKIAALAVAIAVMAACSSSQRPRYSQITFSHLPQIKFDVAQIAVVNEYVAPGKAPNVEHLFPVPLAGTVERWAHDRLRAVGARGQLRFVIKRASVVEVPLKMKTGIRGALTTDQSERYDAVIEVGLEVSKDGGKSSIGTRVKRTRTVPENVTLNEREKVWFEMTEAMIRDLDASLDRQARERMANYIRR